MTCSVADPPQKVGTAFLFFGINRRMPGSRIQRQSHCKSYSARSQGSGPVDVKKTRNRVHHAEDPQRGRRESRRETRQGEVRSSWECFVEGNEVLFAWKLAVNQQRLGTTCPLSLLPIAGSRGFRRRMTKRGIEVRTQGSCEETMQQHHRRFLA